MCGTKAGTSKIICSCRFQPSHSDINQMGDNFTLIEPHPTHTNGHRTHSACPLATEGSLLLHHAKHFEGIPQQPLATSYHMSKNGRISLPATSPHLSTLQGTGGPRGGLGSDRSSLMGSVLSSLAVEGGIIRGRREEEAPSEPSRTQSFWTHYMCVVLHLIPQGGDPPPPFSASRSYSECLSHHSGIASETFARQHYST